MKKLSREWGFEIVNSSPRYAKSNGFAEKMVGIAKSILRKAGTETNYISDALLAHRNTLISGTNVYPAQCKSPFQLSSYDEFGPERDVVEMDDITIPDSEERERHSQDTENILKRAYVTRKGRTVRPPFRLRDFVM
ncbi:hypothetical protein AVEN_229411-1 [Araneus ventricosus]|uniref:Integrase catalytic domain-containing protein n=1 Tax=Araneus ventricosus TaxID=182803 RepID=A0A4Y2MII8_ARAVE|nr:hypothetical protein AVEN_229411-1 [Araneus ventricosus]